MFRRKQLPSIAPEWLIVGLGNPGPEYARTKHNVGFEVIDRLAKQHEIRLGTSKHRSIYGLGLVHGSPVALVKPLTFMNNSGQAVAALARSFGIKSDHILVVADDLDLALGRVRLKPGGSHGGHNGHRSIIALLGTTDYPRLKIGIGKVGKSETIDHVLGGFTPEERVDIEKAIEKCVKGCEAIVEFGVERALSVVNEPRQNLSEED